jgi:hypothetical protein
VAADGEVDYQRQEYRAAQPKRRIARNELLFSEEPITKEAIVVTREKDDAAMSYLP